MKIYWNLQPSYRKRQGGKIDCENRKWPPEGSHVTALENKIWFDVKDWLYPAVFNPVFARLPIGFHLYYITKHWNHSLLSSLAALRNHKHGKDFLALNHLQTSSSGGSIDSVAEAAASSLQEKPRSPALPDGGAGTRLRCRSTKNSRVECFLAQENSWAAT